MGIKDLLVMKTPVPTLGGRTVLITGAASGIGRATAEAAARDGAQLVLTDLHADALDDVVKRINTSGGEVVYHQAGDISDHQWVSTFAR